MNRSRIWHIFIAPVFLGLEIGGIAWFLLKNSSQKDNDIIRPLTKEEAYFFPLKIHGYSSANLPYLEVVIENKRFSAEIVLGDGGMISIPFDISKEFDKKKLIKTVQSYGLTGKIHENNVYELEKIEIEDIAFFPIKMEEQILDNTQDTPLKKNEESIKELFGIIGWRLFDKSKLLIDCKNSLLALCDSLDTLKQHGYPTESFTEVSLLLSSLGFIEVEALTEAGLLHCVLNTGSVRNLLNKNMENENNDHMIFNDKDIDPSLLNPENKDLLTYDPEDTHEFSSFKIGGKEFGPLTVDRIKSPLAIDVMLGMEFFHHTLVFMDFANRKIYFFPYPSEEKAEERDEENILTVMEKAIK